MLALTLTLVQLLSPDPSGPWVDAYGDPLPPGTLARFGTVRWRCPDPPEHLIWSPDGKYLVGTHGGKGLTIWAYPDGVVAGRATLPEPVWDGLVRPGLQPEGLTIGPDQVRFQPDGQSFLVYAGLNQLYRVALPGGRWARVPTSDDRVIARGISADGRRLVGERPIAYRDRRAFGAPTVLELGRPYLLPGRRYTELPVALSRDWSRWGFFGAGPALSADGRFVITAFDADADGGTAAFDLVTGQSWLHAEEHSYHVLFAPDGRTWFTHGPKGLARWEFRVPAPDGPSRLDCTARADPLRLGRGLGAWCVTPDGAKLVLADYGAVVDKTRVERGVVLLDARTFRPLLDWTVVGEAARIPEDHVGRSQLSRPAALAVGPNGRTLAVALAGCPRVQLFDLDTAKPEHAQGGHWAPVNHLVVTAGGRELLSASGDFDARLWDLAAARRSVKGRAADLRERDVWTDLRQDELPKPRRTTLKVVCDPARDSLEVREDRDERMVRELGGGWHDERLNPWRGGVPSAASADSRWVAYRRADAVVVRDLDTGEEFRALRAPDAYPTAVEFTADSDRLVVGYHDGQVLVWDLLPDAGPSARPTRADFDRLWSDLGKDARSATRARATMLAHPTATLAALAAVAKPFPRPTDFEIDEWLARLAHPRYAERERVCGELCRHYDAARVAMQELLKVNRSPEVQQRLRAILDRRGVPVPDAQARRLIRAVAVLEWIGTAEAKDLVTKIGLGGGLPSPRAFDALERLRKSPREEP